MQQQKHFCTTRSAQILADTITPVEVYLRLRDVFAESILLETSGEYQEHHYSYICCQPVASYSVQSTTATMLFPNGTEENIESATREQLCSSLQYFAQAFAEPTDMLSTPFVSNGLFGYIGYDAVRSLAGIAIQPCNNNNRSLPAVCFRKYRFVLVFDHRKQTLHFYEHSYPHTCEQLPVTLERVIELCRSSVRVSRYAFALNGEEQSNMSDAEFLTLLRKAKQHVLHGDVFQLVLSRRFSRCFLGDEFNVYRALRSINPSPYLFYFDYGNYKLFGSSPEAQLIIEREKAHLTPIAGTFRRTGNAEEDQQLAERLLADPKENAEHVMLVDLARNDISRHCSDIAVGSFKRIQAFSHVLHMVSHVTGTVGASTNYFDIIADTFPAGTLSGAPKHRAMELIATYEPDNRGYYGGSIGVMDAQGRLNHAIMIRTFMSKNNTLHYQAGAGVVANSIPENEAEEVRSKLLALNQALQHAGEVL